MIFPEEYKFVGVKDRERRGEPVYFATEYLISRDGPGLYHVTSRGTGFMREVIELEPISFGQEIMFYPDIADTRNRAKLIELAENICRSGRENVYVSGEVMGLGRRRIDARFQDIANFAEIGEFMDRPVREYSSGMYLRLAFSKAIHVDPDILVVDEALAVGDAVFSARCVRKFEQFQTTGKTVLLVSHDLGLVKWLASRAVFLVDGQVRLWARPATP